MLMIASTVAHDIPETFARIMTPSARVSTIISSAIDTDTLASAAIAALANVPVAVAENMMIETRAEGVMILAKVGGMSWATVRAIINMRDDLSGIEPTDLQACKSTYERLRPSTAQQVLRFHRMQQQGAPAA